MVDIHYNAAGNASQAILAVSAILVLNSSSGERILAKYYPHTDYCANVKRQHVLESKLFSRARNSSNEVCMCDGLLAVYRCQMDLIFFVIGDTRTGCNELVLDMVLDTLVEVMTDICKPQLDRRHVLESYDLLALAVDEIVDSGYVFYFNSLTNGVALFWRLTRLKLPGSFANLPLPLVNRPFKRLRFLLHFLLPRIV